ncbi:MAG: hypothetical protein GAK45_00652 [Pseudomonas citronellolis]|nr:MAG: hypothetical protein GAK45_00652 [Pseudomonas citronellolis]
MTTTTDNTGKQYAPRLPKGTFTCLRVNLNAPLMGRVTAIQRDPRFAIQGARSPSVSLLIRRALALYLEQLARMDDAQLKAEMDRLPSNNQQVLHS